MARHTSRGLVVSGSTPVRVVVTHASSNLVSIIYAWIYRRGSGTDCKSVAFGLGWFNSISRHHCLVSIVVITPVCHTGNTSSILVRGAKYLYLLWIGY